MISVSNLSMNFGQQVLFEDVSFQLNSGQIYGLVGANGSGKSTLLRILAGEITPEYGEVNRPTDLRVGVLGQDQFAYDEFHATDVVMMGKPKLWKALNEKSFLEGRELDAVQGHRLAELEMIIADEDGYQAEAQAAELLAGLGLMDPKAPMKSLSGGYRLRVLLAQCLFGKPDFLMLDEPTNHLDLASIRWLEEHLKEYCDSALLISHDRHFLNAVCNRMLDVDYEEVRQYKGNYDSFVNQKEQEVERKEAAIEQQEKKKEELEAFVERFKAKASKARQAASRAKQIDKLPTIEIKRSSRKAPNFRFQQRRPTGKEVLRVEGLNKSYGQRQVIKNLSFSLRRGHRLAVIGPNGIGKSTLLKLILGQLEPDSGVSEWGHEVHWGYFPQDHKELVQPGTSAYEWLYSFDTGATIGRIRSLLGAVLLSGDSVHKDTGALSGGESARLILARLMLAEPNLLLIDEPTNHLDLESIQALASALKNFEGSAIIVSHDRAFIEEVATEVLELTWDGYQHFQGSYNEYLAKEGQDYLDRSAQTSARPMEQKTAAAPKPAAPTEVKKRVPKVVLSGKDAYQMAKDQKNLRKKVKTREAEVAKLEGELAQLESKFAEGSLYQAGKEADLRQANSAKEALQTQLKQASQLWETDAAKLEELLDQYGEL